MGECFHIILDDVLDSLPNALHVAKKNLAFDPSISAWLRFKQCGSIVWDILNAFRDKDWNKIRAVPLDGAENFIIIHPYRGIIIAQDEKECALCTVTHAGWVNAAKTEENWQRPLYLLPFMDRLRGSPIEFEIGPSSSSSERTMQTRWGLELLGPDSVSEQTRRSDDHVRRFLDQREGLFEVDELPPFARPEPPKPTPILAEHNLGPLALAASKLSTPRAQAILDARDVATWTKITKAQSPLDRYGHFHPLIIDILERRANRIRMEPQEEVTHWIQANSAYYEEAARETAMIAESGGESEL